MSKCETVVLLGFCLFVFVFFSTRDGTQSLMCSDMDCHTLAPTPERVLKPIAKHTVISTLKRLEQEDNELNANLRLIN